MDFTWAQGHEKRLKKTHSSTTLKRSGDEGLPGLTSPSSAGGRTLKSSASDPYVSYMAASRQSARERIQAFQERHNPLNKTQPDERSRFDGRLSYAKLQRELTQASQDYDNARFLGSRGVEGFRTFLISRFGSVVAGWRQLDVNRNGRLTYYEFINSCRKLGYHGNLKQLWGLLDENHNGSVSLMEIDAEAGHYVGTFKIALIKKYGDVLTAWQKGIDKNKTGRIEQREIDECCEDLGLQQLDTKKLFRFLTVGPPSLGMTLADFDPEAYNRWLSGDVKGLIASRADTEFLDDVTGAEELPEQAFQRGVRGGAKKFRQENVERDRNEVKVQKERDAKMRCGLHTSAGFKQALVSRFGSLYGGWREALDVEGNERIAFSEFSQSLQRLGFHGNVKGLWTDLDARGRGYIAFADLDPDIDAALKELKSKFIAEYGNILLAWLKGLDTKSTGMVTEQQFVNACEKLKFSGDPRPLFRVLQPDVHRAFLTVKDFDTKAFLALSRGDFRMITEPEEGGAPRGDKKLTDLSFLQRQEMCFGYQIQRAWKVAEREDFAKACRVAVPPHQVDTTEEFEYLCKRTYGSLVGAWRFCLDFDGKGKLPFGEFCKALRRLGFAGDFQTLFKKYDKDQKHFILLKDLDPEAEQIITSFLELLGDRYGELEKAWRIGFKKDPHECIDEATLKEGCEAVGYPHSVHKLFRCLQPMPGRKVITIWDLDPECTRKRQRGDPALIATPKSPDSRLGHRTSTLKSQDTLDTSARAKSPSLGATEATIEASIPMLEQLRRALKHKYGSTVVAWRTALDPDFVGTLAFGRFNMILDECAFKGNRKAIWQELLQGRPRDRSHITFQDIDSDTQIILDSARGLLLDRFGCLNEAWQKGLDVHRLEKLREEDFMPAWESLAFEHAWSAKKLFGMLLAGRHPRLLVKEDLDALMIGVPPPDRLKMRDGATGHSGTLQKTLKTVVSDVSEDNVGQRTLTPQGEALGSASPGGRGSSPTRSDFDASTSLTLPWSPKATRQYSLTFPAADISENNHKLHEHDVIVSSLANFRKTLVSKHGSIFSAWHHALDTDHNDVVTLRDFADACRKLGVKSTQQIWMEFDRDSKGQVSLKDLDQETWEGYTSLERLLVEKYGSTLAGWNEAFDVGKKVTCDQAAFVAGCQKLGLEGDTAGLFRLLRPEPGRAQLAYADLWFTADSRRSKKVTQKLSSTAGA